MSVLSKHVGECEALRIALLRSEVESVVIYL